MVKYRAKESFEIEGKFFKEGAIIEENDGMFFHYGTLTYLTKKKVEEDTRWEKIGFEIHRKDINDNILCLIRIKDNVKITVGDYIEYDHTGYRIQAIIENNIWEGGFFVIAGNMKIGIGKVEHKRKPFIVSVEGIRIYYGDEHYIIVQNNNRHLVVKTTDIFDVSNSRKKRFKYKKNAQTYSEIMSKHSFITEDGVKKYAGDTFVSVSTNAEHYKRYSIIGENIRVGSFTKKDQENARRNNVLWFSDIESAKKYLFELRPIYETEDGILIYDKEDYIGLYGIEISSNNIFEKATTNPPRGRKKWFFYKENAKDYLVNTTRLLSIEDLQDIVDNNPTDVIKDKIKELVKERLNLKE